jgi:hypothetical protein
MYFFTLFFFTLINLIKMYSYKMFTLHLEYKYVIYVMQQKLITHVQNIIY